MARFRSIVAVVIAVIATALFLFGNPAEAAKAVKKPTYTASQLEQIQQYTTGVETLRERMLELPPLIQSQNWVDVKTFIHGPLGELGPRMSRLARSLDPKTQKLAQSAAKDVFGHLVAIDEAADLRDTTKALRNYNEAIKDFDTFFGLIPS